MKEFTAMTVDDRVELERYRTATRAIMRLVSTKGKILKKDIETYFWLLGIDIEKAAAHTAQKDNRSDLQQPIHF